MVPTKTLPAPPSMLLPRARAVSGPAMAVIALLALLALLVPLVAPAAGAEAEPGAADLDCIRSELGTDASAADAVLACVPGAERGRLTVVDLGAANAECVLYAQWPYVADGPDPLDAAPMLVWGALSVCDVEAVHGWVGHLDHVGTDATITAAPGVSEGPTQVAMFLVEQPCASVLDGEYQVTVIGQYKPLELTALPVAAVDTTTPHHVECPGV